VLDYYHRFLDSLCFQTFYQRFGPVICIKQRLEERNNKEMLCKNNKQKWRKKETKPRKLQKEKEDKNRENEQTQKIKLKG
jgi:hypothetical protein